MLRVAEERQGAFDKQQFNVYLPLELVKQIKHAAIEEDYSLSGFVEHILREYMARTGREVAHER